MAHDVVGGPELAADHAQRGEDLACTVGWMQGHSWPVLASVSYPLESAAAVPALQSF